ncbi:MAG: NADH-quinone oxidoreductase subunit C [Balneolaceae bacterium]
MLESLSDSFSDPVLDIYESTGSTFVRIKPASLLDVCRFLHDEHRFIYLADLFGTDRYTSTDRFEVIYNLLSFRDRQRLFLKVWLGEEDPEIDSVSGIWKAANWFEREVYDMFGIRFRNHPDFRRIYMPEDYNYFPLRKEFPLLGIPGSIEMPSTTPDSD